MTATNTPRNNIALLNKLLCDYFDGDSGIVRTIYAQSTSYIMPDQRGICAYGTTGGLVVELHSTNDACPGIRIFCNAVSDVAFSFTSEYNPRVKESTFGTYLYLNENETSYIKCESLSYEVLDQECLLRQHHMLEDWETVEAKVDGVDIRFKHNHHTNEYKDFEFV